MSNSFQYIVMDDNNTILINKMDEFNQDLYNEMKCNISTVKTINNEKIRFGLVEYQNGKIYAYTKNKNYINSSRIFNTHLSTIKDAINFIISSIDEEEGYLKKQIDILIHNLISINAHNTQEVFNVLPQNKFGSVIDAKKITINTIKANPDKAATALLNIMKNNYAMKTEFSVFVRLFDEHNPNIKKEEHSIHKVIMNSLYSFFPDFTDSDILIVVVPTNLRIKFDYESISVVFYYILENATKYIEKSSTFNIYFEETDKTYDVLFEMISLKITNEEKSKIFSEGYSGEFARKKHKEGKGIGMSRVKRILHINNATIELICSESEKYSKDYQKNIFKISFNK